MVRVMESKGLFSAFELRMSQQADGCEDRRARPHGGRSAGQTGPGGERHLSPRSRGACLQGSTTHQGRQGWRLRLGWGGAVPLSTSGAGSSSSKLRLGEQGPPRGRGATGVDPRGDEDPAWAVGRPRGGPRGPAGGGAGGHQAGRQVRVHPGLGRALRWQGWGSC